ncbi:MAG: class I SAM-dependent methyltransferase [Patescibacteria group bacterium]|nr:class I SAM-dependent methyltransferase [Patescibacteria group bacterium]
MDFVGKKTLEVMNKARNYNSWLFRLIKPYLGRNVLEIGSGIGNFTKMLAEVSDVYASDVDEYYLSYLKKNFKSVKSKYVNIETGVNRYGKIKFDSILCMNVLEHIKNDQEAISHMYGFLKHGGTLILIVPAFMFAYGKLDESLGHYRRYTRCELEKKLKKLGFFVLESRYVNFIGIFGWWFNSKLVKSDIIPTSHLSFFDKIFAPFLFIEKFIKFPVGLSVFAVAQKK